MQLQKKKFKDESQLQKEKSKNISKQEYSVCISFINEFSDCAYTYLYVNDLPKQSFGSQDWKSQIVCDISILSLARRNSQVSTYNHFNCAYKFFT